MTGYTKKGKTQNKNKNKFRSPKIDSQLFPSIKKCHLCDRGNKIQNLYCE